ncbi:MAG TPA: FAD-binding oxidoreductase [Candidatus Pristimantibacillus sp.]|nr:FAD-binding oxidoreductase [Candidatus Pristimantibacillus sp.]
MDEQHKKTVAAVARQVKKFYKEGNPFRVYHGSTNSTRVLEFDRGSMVDVSQLNRVLKVDTKKKAALVEPNVPMDKLVEATLPYGLVPPVVMEFPGITVAGGLQGGAGESSSFKWGGFAQTLNWFDVVLGNGDKVRASAKENADLFYGSSGAYGTLGVVTAAEVQLIPAKRYVNVTYHPVSSFDEATKLILKLTKQSHDFIDGILYSATCGVIVAGTLSDTPHGPVKTFTRRHDPWFYLHTEKFARAGETYQESIPIKDYLFRYDRGAFWMGQYAYERFKTPFNSLTRWLMDRVMHTRPMYDALQASGVSQEFVIQDLAMPKENAVEFMKWTDKHLGIYPLWLCPLKIHDPGGKSPLVFRPLKDGMAINVGVWGPVSRDLDTVIKANRHLEAKVTSLGGRKWLYAYAYYTEQEFWTLYDRKWYDDLRRKYHAETLPTIYDKICRNKKAQIHTKHGVLKALMGQSGIRLHGRKQS